MNNAQYQSEESLGYMTATTHRLLSSTLRRQMKNAGLDISSEQWGVLMLLWEKEHATQDELAHAACVDKSSMSRVLSLMEAKNLVTRRTDPANERKKIICATPESYALRELGFAVTGTILREAVSGATPAEIAACFKVLNIIKQNLRT